MKGYFRKRGNKWSFSIDTGRDRNGKRKQKTVSGFSTKKEAQYACNELINQLNKGVYIETKDQTLKEFILEYMNSIAKQTLRQRSFDNHMVVINKHIIPDLGQILITKITPAQVQQFYGKKLDDGYSADYVKYMHTVLKKSFTQGVKWQYINKNVIDLVDPPRIIDKEIQTWSLKEANQFLDHVENERFYTVYLLALYTGMRKGEILGVRWKDCDLINGKISVRQTLSKTTQGIVFQEPKTKGSKRLVSIPEHVIKHLKKHKSGQNETKLLLGSAYQDGDLVASIENGKPIDPRNINRHFTRMIKLSELPKLRFHDLRHTHATILLQLGEHPKIVSERLGHSKISITLDIYSHVIPDMQKDTASNFEKAMNKAKKSL